MAGPRALDRGVTYHIFNRGVDRERLFRDHEDYVRFLHLYTHHVVPYVDTYAYILMGNHFHLLARIRLYEELPIDLRTRHPSQAFSNLFNAYARYYNRKYGRTGTLFERPFSRVPVRSDEQFHRLVLYIHHNPIHHGFVDDYWQWPYSSFHHYIGVDSSFVAIDEVVARFQGRANVLEEHERWKRSAAFDDDSGLH